MRTKLRDNSCKNHRILLPLLHPCALQFSCALHLFALLSDHTHIHFCFCLHGFGAVLTHVIPIRAAFVVFRVFVSRIFVGTC